MYLYARFFFTETQSLSFLAKGTDSGDLSLVICVYHTIPNFYRILHHAYLPAFADPRPDIQNQEPVAVDRPGNRYPGY